MAAAAVLLLANSFASAKAPSKRRAAALAQFENAQRLRAQLQELRPEERTRRDYQQVIQSYRRVYFITPASSKADASIENSAELLEQEGAEFGDAKASEEAIKQYRFLIAQYPGSRYKPQAMFAIGKIYQNDLRDNAEAAQAFEDFLKVHPKHPLSSQARSALQAMGDGSSSVAETAQAGGADKESKSDVAREKTPKEPADASVKSSDEEVEITSPPASSPTSSPNSASAALVTPTTADAPRNGERALLTAIRHWTMPDYTRVIITLDKEVSYDAGRIDSPDRIFFDLHGTRVARALEEKSFAVDDGLLRRIRVAEYQPGTARVVLEVAPGSTYSAFLLPNPQRLIIEVRPRAAGQTTLAQVRTAPAAQLNALTKSVQPTAEKGRDSSSGNLNAATARSAAGGAIASGTVETAEGKKGEGAQRTILSAAPRSGAVPQPSAAQSPVNAKSIAPELAQSRSSAKPLEAATGKKVIVDDPPSPEINLAANSTQSMIEKPAPEVQGSPPSRHRKAGAKGESAIAMGREAAPASGGERTLIRALGLKIGKIVIDAGHGGHDTGTIGPNGLMEKDLVLDVGLRLGRLLENRMGADVVYTRKDDTFIPLQERTAIANQDQADLFISIHANSSRDTQARGIEVYYLNFTSSAEALEVAARENASADESIHDLQDLVKKIALQEKIDESREFAADVDRALHTGLSHHGNSMRDRGVKKAPFVVLIGAHMPSILSEISFLSNPKDERLLRKPEYRQRIAEALYRGIEQYVRGLSGIKLAAVSSAAAQ